MFVDFEPTPSQAQDHESLWENEEERRGGVFHQWIGFHNQVG